MNRRRYLALTAIGASSIAGCSGSDGGEQTTDSGSSETQAAGSTAVASTDSTTTTGSTTASSSTTETGTQTETTTANSGGASALEISGTDLEEGEFETAVIGEVENTGEQRFAYVEVTATFRNDAGDVLDTTMTNLAGLEAGQVWEVYIPFLGDGAEVAEGELSVSDTTTGAIPDPPETVELVEDSLEPPADDYSGPIVTGRAENTGDSTIGYLEAAATFLSSDGAVLGSSFTNVTDLPAGETWSFEIEFTSYSSDASDDVDDYDLYLTDSPF